ncbi:MAG: hypothetical protein WBP45_05310 [Daejeonella sp.]
MKDPQKSKKPMDSEDEISADMNNSQRRENIKVKGFKTRGSKQDKYYNLPFDEQMYDSPDMFGETEEDRGKTND